MAAGGAAWVNQLILTGDAVADAQQVSDLCDATAPQLLQLSSGAGGGLSLDLRILDADTIKTCFVALASTIRAQAKQISSLREAVAAGDPDGMVRMAGQIKELEQGLVNLAQNVQGFTEADSDAPGDEEPALEAAAYEKAAEHVQAFVPAHVAAHVPAYEAADQEMKARLLGEARERAMHAELERDRALAAAAARAASEANRDRELNALQLQCQADADDFAAGQESAARRAADAEAAMRDDMARMMAEMSAMASDAERARAAAKLSAEQGLAEAARAAAEVALADKRQTMQRRISARMAALTQRKVSDDAAVAERAEKMVEARRLWRKCIRAAIRINRQKGSAVGVLKSRAMRGMSVNDRIKRIEEKLFTELHDVRAELETNTDADRAKEAALRGMQARLAALEAGAGAAPAAARLKGVEGRVAALSQQLAGIGEFAEQRREAVNDKLTALADSMAFLRDEFQAQAEAHRRHRADGNAAAEMTADVDLRQKRETLSKKAAEAQALMSELAVMSALAQGAAAQDDAAGDSAAGDGTVDGGGGGVDEQSPAAVDRLDEQSLVIAASGPAVAEVGVRAVAEVGGAAAVGQQPAPAAVLATVTNMTAMMDSIDAKCREALTRIDESVHGAWGDVLARAAKRATRGDAPGAGPDVAEALEEDLRRLEVRVCGKADGDDVNELAARHDALAARAQADLAEVNARIAALEATQGALRRQADDVEVKLEVLDSLDWRIQTEVKRLVELLLAARAPGAAAPQGAPSARRDDVDALARQVQAQAERIASLFATKAERSAVEAGLESKMDRSSMDAYATRTMTSDLEELLRRLRAEVQQLRGLTDREVQGLKRRLEALVADAMAAREANDASAATRVCLMCARDVPETSSIVDAAHEHRRLLPRLNSPDAGARSLQPGSPEAYDARHAGAANDVVFRGGFRMPLGAGTARSAAATHARPGTEPPQPPQASGRSGRGFGDAAEQLRSATLRPGTRADSEGSPQSVDRPLAASSSLELYAPPPGRHAAPQAKAAGPLGGKVLRQRATSVVVPMSSNRRKHSLFAEAEELDRHARGTIAGNAVSQAQ